MRDGACEERSPFADNHDKEVDLDAAAAIATAPSSSSSPSDDGVLPVHDDDDEPDSIFGVKLETFIVGRRYTDQEEICPGATVSLFRDPQNVKDPNAIKVFVFLGDVYQLVLHCCYFLCVV